MRLAPVALRYGHAPSEAIARAADSSRTTHAAAEAVDACRYLAALLVGALSGMAKEELLDPNFPPPAAGWSTDSTSAAVRVVAAGSFKEKRRHDISSSGYAIHTLEAALWAFHNSTTFRDGALLAVNLAGDADTVGAVYGQLAGAYYGTQGIPSEWTTRLTRRQHIESLADHLHRCAFHS